MSPGSGHLRGVPADDPADPLARRAAFEQAHPDITITPPGGDDPWWTARRDGQYVASAYMLGRLMDSLDRLIGGQT